MLMRFLKSPQTDVCAFQGRKSVTEDMINCELLFIITVVRMRCLVN